MIGWALGWWDEKSDLYREANYMRDDKPPLSRARWAVANRLNKQATRCWSILAEFAMGWTLQPGGKDVGPCRKSALEVGTCYCGKFIRADLAGEVDNISERVVVEP